MDAKQKEAAWLGSSKEVLRSFPKPVRRKLGHAVWEAQLGRFPQGAKPLHAFGGASVVEILADHDGNAYRAVLYRAFCGFRLGVTCISKEVKERRQDAGECR